MYHKLDLTCQALLSPLLGNNFSSSFLFSNSLHWCCSHIKITFPKVCTQEKCTKIFHSQNSFEKPYCIYFLTIFLSKTREVFATLVMKKIWKDYVFEFLVTAWKTLSMCVVFFGGFDGIDHWLILALSLSVQISWMHLIVSSLYK